MGTLLFDLSDAVRGLRRDYGFTAVVLLTLALTIGAATAVFSIVDGVLLKPLTYRQPERLVALHEVWHEFADRIPSLEVNERHFNYWREHSHSFESMAQYLLLPANLTGGGEASQISLLRASGTLFDVLGVNATLGRTLRREDEPRDQPDVAVISDRLWRRRFSASPEILGTPITIDGRPFTVVGVLPADFRLPMSHQLSTDVDAIVPVRVEVGWVGDHNDLAIGRLRDGITIDEARAELDVLQRQVSDIATREGGETVTLSAAVTPLTESIVGRARRGLLLLLGAVMAVLLIACSNLANLSLSRALARTREGAIRSALGASRWRLIRRAVLEHLVLSGAGAFLGIWIASLALAIFVRTAPIDLPRVDQVSLDGRVLLFAVGVATLAALLVSLLPAWRVTAGDAQTTLRGSGAAAGADRGSLRARSALMALQVALSVMLLATTTLLGTSLLRVLEIDRGFSSDRVIAVPVALPIARYADEPARVPIYDRILTEVRALPAVRSATVTSTLPMHGQGQVNFVVAEGVRAPRSDQPSANFRFVAPEFFQALEIPLLRGRAFTIDDRDPERAVPAVISGSLAERLWPGQNPLGRGFSRGIDGERDFEVVGVAAEARTTSIEQKPPFMVYLPYWWRNRASTSLLVKATVDPNVLVPDIRRVLRNIDPEIAIGQTRLLNELLDAALAGRRYQTELFVVFGVVALFIATLGVYAVTAYNLSRRRREMNIRVALGARTTDVLRLIVQRTGGAVLLGVATGIAGALALGGLVASLLYEVHPRDPAILGIVGTVVASIALVATLMAARHGLSISPVSALRDE